jgi:hypothetical protein
MSNVSVKDFSVGSGILVPILIHVVSVVSDCKLRVITLFDGTNPPTVLPLIVFSKLAIREYNTCLSAFDINELSTKIINKNRYNELGKYFTLLECNMKLLKNKFYRDNTNLNTAIIIVDTSIQIMKLS